jgi:isoprenylcysteine carboxyl methyltransferase (ICMT) family protein YpbQ
MSIQQDTRAGIFPPEKSATLPRSCTNMAINLTGLTGFFAALIAFSLLPQVTAASRAVICILALVVPIAALEIAFLKNHRRGSTGLDFTKPQVIDGKRVAVKLVGLYGTITTIAVVYWLLPLYHETFFQPFWQTTAYGLPIIMILAVPYFLVLDRYMIDPEDAYYHAGLAFLGQRSITAGTNLRQFALGWTVKGFFLPLMFVYLTESISFLLDYDRAWLGASFIGFYEFAWNVTLAIDLVFVCTGYILTLRVLDSHIRTTEPTLTGWLPTIICYYPFWALLYASYFAYDNDGLTWGGLLATHSVLQVFWGSAILVLMVIYALASTAFGLRFSNLTHRGILTNGPYRWSKHPAYIAKNLTWWMIAMPFISEAGLSEAVRLSLLLASVNLIYYLRARTEERHLSRDPVYVAYATALNERALLSPLARLIPQLKYRPPTHPLAL